MRRVAVTGMGVVSPLGNNITDLYENACKGHSAIHTLNTPFTHLLKNPLAATVNFTGSDYFEPPKLRMLDKVSQLALVATKQALLHANYDLTHFDTSRTGIFIGTAMGGALSNDEGYEALYKNASTRLKPFTVLMGMYNAPAAWIALEYGLVGPAITYSTACSSSSVAIGEAWLRIANGSLDTAIAGGAEAPLSFGSLKSWEALNTLATVDIEMPSASCKPFSKNRTGMILGEGSAMLILEEWNKAVARKIPILGEILGYGLTTDHSHITRPSVEGQAATIRAALQSAKLDTATIDAINAHGTGTVSNDAVETAAIKAVFGQRAYKIPISATKAMHGHLLGAAGALECVLSFLAMQHNVALPTMHLEKPDPECDLDYAPNALRKNVAARTMLSNSFAFGGTNAVLVLGAAS